ncbi:M1 family aminopeptidase [Nakamurella sp. GG22]
MRAVAIGALASALVITSLTPATAAGPVAATPSSTAPSPGSDGIGDPYYPLDGNGGYDVSHYDLNVDYRKDSGVLTGTTRIQAKATQSLSSFNLDLEQLTVQSVKVNGRPAQYTHTGHELVVTPRKALSNGRTFTVEIKYSGVPHSENFIVKDDGAVTIGIPHVAASWFPSNDHPSDKASYKIAITTDKGLEAISNGNLISQRRSGQSVTSTWVTKEPMASYLATMEIGNFKVNTYRDGKVRYLDAISEDLFRQLAPRTGSRFALSNQDYRALSAFGRTINVPASGATVSFYTDRQIQEGADFFFVAARPAGTDQWTTLPDTLGHSSQDVPDVCTDLVGLHPFLGAFLTPTTYPTCTPTGTTGQWNAASNETNGYEQWKVDLSPYAGHDVDLAFVYTSDYDVNLPGVAIDDITVSTGQGTTSFERDGNPDDGWEDLTLPGGLGSWSSATAAETPTSTGEIVKEAFKAQPEIINFFARYFGPYPFSAAGGIVDHLQQQPLGWARQTRSIYPTRAFSTPSSGRFWLSHEIAHQWFGDSVSVNRWSDVWLNEGIAFYATWMWQEHKGLATPQATFDRLYNAVPASDPFWNVKVGDPGVANQFACAIFVRPTMMMQLLRNTVGDEAFFSILKTWTTTNKGGNGTTAEFIALSESISGMELNSLFNDWLFTTTKPSVQGLPLTTADSQGQDLRYLSQQYIDDITAGRCFDAGLAPLG